MKRPGHGSVAFPLALLLLSGCATIGQAEPETSERLVRTTKETRASSEFSAEVQQDRTIVEVTASKLCEVVSKPVVERTTTRDSINKTPSTDYLVGGVGAAMVLTGGIVLVDSSNVYTNDDTSRTYNSVGPDTAKGIGWSTLAVGGALLMVPVIDALRASGSDVEVQQVTKDGEVVEPKVACPGHPLQEAKVMVDVDSVEFEGGTTDKHGTVQFDLDSVFGDEVKLEPNGKAKIVINGKTVGEVSLKALYEQREARAWSSVSVQECKSPTTPGSCGSVAKYLRDWPDGKHAPMAREVLQEARPAIMRLRDEKTWTDADPKKCDEKDDTIHGVNEACSGVRSYLNDYPEGIHAEEAKKLVEKADKRVAKINERLEKEAREEERKRKAEEEAERRRVEREERAEAEKERRKCQAECNLGCSGWQFRHNPGECRRNCYVVRCSE